jgi:hypothetical protein
MEVMMQNMIKELTGDELETVSGGMTDTGKSGSDTLSDILKWILKQITVPATLGGTSQKH